MITLEPDVSALVKKRMKERGETFKEAVNEALRDGLLHPTATSGSSAYETPSFDLGPARVDLDHALRLAASLEDDVRVASPRDST